MHDRLRQIGQNGLTFFPGANPYDDLTATSTGVVISHGAAPRSGLRQVEDIPVLRG